MYKSQFLACTGKVHFSSEFKKTIHFPYLHPSSRMVGLYLVREEGTFFCIILTAACYKGLSLFAAVATTYLHSILSRMAVSAGRVRLLLLATHRSTPTVWSRLSFLFFPQREEGKEGKIKDSWQSAKKNCGRRDI